MPPTVVPESSVDTRPSGITASQERSVVDEYYVRGVQSPQASMIMKTFGANSQDSQGVSTSAGFASVVTLPGVSTQSTLAKPNVAPLLLDTPIKTSPVMPTTAQSSRVVTDTSTVALPKPDVAMPGGTTTPNPISTAPAPKVPAAAVPTAPVVSMKTLYTCFLPLQWDR